MDDLISEAIRSSQITSIKKNEISLEYLNDAVRATYLTMRNNVINHITKKVALSLLNFNVNGFAAENIASYVADGTKPFLPFEFANGVKITKVTPKGGSIIYRTALYFARPRLRISIDRFYTDSSSAETVAELAYNHNLMREA